MVASDVSADAIAVAKENFAKHEANVTLVKSDMFAEFKGKFNVIISNPPYIKSQEVFALQKEVKDFEPTIALDGGEDGYKFYRIIAKNAKNHLSDGGVLLLECGVSQAQTVKDMLDGYKSVEIIKDYENIDRIVKAVF